MRRERATTALALHLALGLALLVAAPRASAQQATVTMVADTERVEVGGMLRLTVRAEIVGDSTSQVVLPDLSAFDVVQRQVSRPFTIRMGTGQGTHVQATEMHALVLRARTPGRHTLAPAAVQIGGQRFESRPLTIVVGDGGGDALPGAPDQPPGPPAAGSGDGTSVDGMTFDGDAFVRTWVDRGSPYVGQQVTVTIYLYTRQPLRGSPAITQEATTDGFWVHDLVDRNQPLSPETQRLSGTIFHVYRLRRFAAFPLRAGELTIGPTRIEVTQNSIFDLLGGGGGTPSWSRTGVPVTVRVEELPEAGRPRGDVHVGALELTAELDRAQVQTGDAVTLTVTARGRGPVDQLRLPSPTGDGLRVLEPELRDQVTSPSDVVGGTRIARWLIVPERPGTYRLGPFEVPVFDPETGRYTVARAEALTLLAAGNAPPGTAEPEPSQDATAPSAPSERDAARFGPVRTRSALARSHAAWTEAPWFLALFGLGPLALIAALGLSFARKRAGRVDPAGAPRRAKKAAKQRLSAAEKHAAAAQPREFYASIALALKEVVEAKLGRAVGSLTHAELRATLTERGLPTEVAGAVVDELEGCDFARFSAVGVSAEEMQRCLARTQELLAKLDRFSPRTEASA